MQVTIDQLSYGPLNNLMNMAFFTLLVESARPRCCVPAVLLRTWPAHLFTWLPPLHHRFGSRALKS
jgi:hypothetical protein